MTEPSSRRSGYARLLDRAIRILAMRDHSEQELRRKLVAPVMSKNGPEALDVTPTSWSRLSPGVSKPLPRRQPLRRPVHRQPEPQRLWSGAHSPSSARKALRAGR